MAIYLQNFVYDTWTSIYIYRWTPDRLGIDSENFDFSSSHKWFSWFLSLTYYLINLSFYGWVTSLPICFADYQRGFLSALSICSKRNFSCIRCTTMCRAKTLYKSEMEKEKPNLTNNKLCCLIGLLMKTHLFGMHYAV